MDKDTKLALAGLFSGLTGDIFVKFIESKIEEERRWLEKDISECETANRRGRIRAYRNILVSIQSWLKLKEETLKPEDTLTESETLTRR